MNNSTHNNMPEEYTVKQGGSYRPDNWSRPAAENIVHDRITNELKRRANLNTEQADMIYFRIKCIHQYSGGYFTRVYFNDTYMGRDRDTMLSSKKNESIDLATVCEALEQAARDRLASAKRYDKAQSERKARETRASEINARLGQYNPVSVSPSRHNADKFELTIRETFTAEQVEQIARAIISIVDKRNN